jgi:hypothetical protein
MHPAQLQGDDHTQGCWNNNKEKKEKRKMTFPGFITQQGLKKIGR